MKLSKDQLSKNKSRLYDDDAKSVMKTICDAGRTGKFGDGGIFVSPVDISGKVRTGEIDYDSTTTEQKQ